MKIKQYEDIERSVNENPTQGIRKSTLIRVLKVMDKMPTKYKGGIKAFISDLIESALDNVEIEYVPREEQATI